LGNRLFSLSDAIDYALRTSRIIYVDWTDGGLGPRSINMFHSFFSLNGIPCINSISEIDNIASLSFYPYEWKSYPEAKIYDYYRFYNSFNPNSKKVNRLFNRVRSKLSKKFKAQQYGCWKRKDDSGLADMRRSMPLGQFLSTKRSEDIVIYCDYTPKFKRNIFLKHVALKTCFHEKILDIRKKIFSNKKVIGLHIRSTDKKPERSIDDVKDLITSSKFKDFNFFVSTDNAKIYNNLKKISNVIVYPKIIPSTKTGGIHRLSNSPEYSYPEQMLEDSLIDLWLLSSCHYLWYQGNSTYSIIACALHGNTRNQWDWNSESLSDIKL